MKTIVKRQKAVPGFTPTTYAVFCGEYLLKIFDEKKQAERFAQAYDDPEARKSLTDDEIVQLYAVALYRYCHYAGRPCGDWRPDMTFPDLEDATDKYDTIGEEILRRCSERS